jgi:hypothetical protein
MTRGGSRAALSQEAGAEATGHVGARERPSCPSSCLRACMRVYPVLRVPTVAPEPTPGYATNPRVGPTSFPVLLF